MCVTGPKSLRNGLKVNRLWATSKRGLQSTVWFASSGRDKNGTIQNADGAGTYSPTFTVFESFPRPADATSALQQWNPPETFFCFFRSKKSRIVRLLSV